jgi:hypothetical protein
LHSRTNSTVLFHFILKERNRIPEIPKWWMEDFQKLILLCLSQDPEKRPTFEDILGMLKTVDDSNDWFIQKVSSISLTF